MTIKGKRVLLIVFPLLLTGIVVFFVFFRHRRLLSLKGTEDFNYLIITVDTLRADRIGCYGFSGVQTPTMDMWASKGIKFEKCIAQTPLTLPSHASLMTGTHPLFHGVRDNGGFLVPQELTTLAEAMKQYNYKTSAFVASYVLDSKWGLNQGFDHYFDKFDLSKYKSISLGNIQRRGDEVVKEVIPWLEKNRQHKFFTWVHLYDPHTPYDPPSPYREMYPKRPYVGEIAYTDSLLGELWQYLKDNGLTEKTILIFASDHGESLGEHQESAHGFFIYQEGVHVPLILVTPFEELQGLSRSAVVSLVDIMPTVLDLAHIPVPAQVQGKSLLSFFFKKDSEKEYFAYSETYYPRFHYGWSELKAYQNSQHKMIVAPELELYDLSLDPQEMNNLAESQPSMTRELFSLINEFMEKTERGAFEMDYSHMDEETRQKLAALGYIGTFTKASMEGRRLGDPKDKIVIFNQLSEARELGLQGEFERASEMIQAIIVEDPDVIDAHFALGNLYFNEGQFENALETFQRALERKPNDSFTVVNIANSYIQMDKLDDAERAIVNALDMMPPDSQIYLILGNIKNRKKEYQEAIIHYKKCIELNPNSASAYSALGGVYVATENLVEAESYLTAASELNSELGQLHYNLALLFEAKGDLSRAMEEYKRELANIPYNFRASYNLSRLYRIQGRVQEEEEQLKATMEINPRFPLSYFYLARIHLNRGQGFQEAVSLVEKGLELKPEEADLPLGYFLLADLYNRLGDQAKSLEYAQKGEEARNRVQK